MGTYSNDRPVTRSELNRDLITVWLYILILVSRLLLISSSWPDYLLELGAFIMLGSLVWRTLKAGKPAAVATDQPPA